MSASNPNQKTTVLLTGAAGRIGTAFREYEGARYQLRLADRDISTLGDSGDEVVALDVADLDACQAACAGMQVVIHLAADPNPRADFYASLLDNNIKGVYNIFRAAKDQGCRRVIFASSIRVLEGHPDGPPLVPDAPVRPIDMYGASKCFGEAVAHYFAYTEGLSSIAVRIGAFEGNWLNRDTATPEGALIRFTSRRDMAQLLARCVDAPDISFAVVHAASDNRRKRLDISQTRELLGFAPQDDGFELYGPPHSSEA
ncbi:MAG TPA: NAD(P)-dependent oxidoreductase [Roseiflexaceae bacterium]|nr:NAD(P)-dependent oxidoreductase [Roseiflexaceae bacterium]